MICYIEHDISVNKQVQRLSHIGRKLVKNPSYDLPKDCWVDFKDWRTLPKRRKLERDTSKSHLYTEMYSFYDTVEKTTKTVKVHTPIMSCSAAEYAICCRQDIQTLHLKNIK